MTNYKYFDKYYIGTRNEGTISGLPLAFAVPDGDDSAAKKRKRTVDAWTMGMWSANDHRGNPRSDITTQGKIYDNKPMKGFKLVDWGSRYSTDNKVVRVVDPRGFELEIYIPNLMEIILNTTVDRGEIKDELVWLRDGANNRLVRATDPAFAEARLATLASGRKKSKNKLQHEVGDIISNAYGDWLYIGLMDVEYVVPRGARVEDKKMTKTYGTRPGGWFRSSNGQPVLDSTEEVFRRFYRIEDDRLESVSIGRRHVYQDVARYAIHNHVPEITFRKTQMAAQEIKSSGNLIPQVGETNYFLVNYESAMFYDEDGNLYTPKEVSDDEAVLNKNNQWQSNHEPLEHNTRWKTMIARIQDGPLQTAPVKGHFDDNHIRGILR